MAGNNFDEKLKKVHFLNDEQIKTHVEEILSSCADKTESIQLQLNIKGYENRKDPTMTKDIVFPNAMKKSPSVCVIGNEGVQPYADKLGIPFILYSDYEGADKKKAREEVIEKYRQFILCQDHAKAFSLREILRKRKRTHFMCPNAEHLENVYKNSILALYRLKVRDWHSVSFPVGHTEMAADDIVENIRHSVQFVSDNLKKGPQNLKGCFIKRTSGSTIRIY